MMEYGILAVIIAGVLGLYYFIAPIIREKKLLGFFGLVEQITKAIQQETVIPENETQAEKDARHAKMKADAMESAREIAKLSGLKLSENVIDNAVEAGVWVLNQVKKFQEGR